MFAATSRSDVQDLVQPASPGCASLPRSFGALDLHFVKRRDITQADRVYQVGVLRARFPNVMRGQPPEAVLINTAGGLTGGDTLKISVDVASASSAVISTQAHEKVYRSSLGAASVISHARVADQATLEWLPQPTILFDGSRLSRETHIELAASASFLGVEAVIFGRTAMDEVMRSGSLCDSWTITRDRRAIHVDRFEVAGDLAALLAKPSVLNGCAAMATIRYVAADAASRLEEMRKLMSHVAGEGAVGLWNGVLLARIVAVNGYLLHHALVPVLTAFRGRTLPAVWSI